MTGPKLLPKWFLHIVRSKASSFKWKYPLLSLRSSSNFLRLLPRLLVTSISPFIFPSITCFRRQFLCKMWPIQLAFRFRIVKILSKNCFCWCYIRPPLSFGTESSQLCTNVPVIQSTAWCICLYSSHVVIVSYALSTSYSTVFVIMGQQPPDFVT